MATEIIWLIGIIGTVVLLIGVCRLTKPGCFKRSLKRRWNAWLEANYYRQLDKYYQDNKWMFFAVEDEPFMEAEDSTLIQLRQQQQADDKAKSEWEQAQRRQEEQAEKFLNYALEHPEFPEAERHLNECLDRALEEIEQVKREKSFYSTQLRFYPRYSPEEASTIARIKQYKLELQKLDQRVMQIHQALNPPSSTE